jgi:hypothetical protein
MPFQVENLPEAIREIKKELRRELPAYATVFQEVENEMRRKVAQIVKERDAGEAVIPVIRYSDIAAGSVSPEMISKIKDRGACVVRNTLSLSKLAPGMRRSPDTWKKTASMRNSRMLPRTSISVRWQRLSHRSMASTGRVLKSRQDKRSLSLESVPFSTGYG